MARVQIYALSEDNSKHAPTIWKALLKKMIRLFAPSHREDAIEYGPVGEPEGLTSYYKSRNDRDRAKRILLKKAIATKLLQNEHSFVIVHLDADEVWSKRTRPYSQNEEQFIKFLKESDWKLTPEQLLKLRQGLEERLLILVPYYSIESWLYQNSAVAIEISKRHYQGRDLEIFRRWAEVPVELDEVEKPKKQTSLDNLHNEELATKNFPASRVNQLGQSFSSAVTRLATCPLAVAIRATGER